MFKHLLIPLDGSSLAEQALPVAMALAARFDGAVTLLRVIQPPYVVTGIGGSVYAELALGLREQIHEEAQTYLAAVRESLPTAAIEVRIQVAEGDPAADLILQMVDELEADTIVMSTHGRTGLSRWVFGSVAERVLRGAAVPVLLIRATAPTPDPGGDDAG
jgi:nucleotide-binding universal stress UspA family protein